MKSFREYLMEAEAEDHNESGTYGALLLSKESKKKLHDWMQKHKIDKLVDAVDYHCTVVFSTKPVPEVKNIPIKLPFTARFKEWKVFGDDKMLVVVLNAPSAKKLFDKTIEMGAKTDYPEYVPHVTVALNYEGEVPKELPDFMIEFINFKVSPLDADFSYSDDEN